MRRSFLFVLLICVFCLPSFGQIRYIAEDGVTYNVYDQSQWEGLPDFIFMYRADYGRYPEDKQALLDYCLEITKSMSDNCFSFYWEIVDMRTYTDENLRAKYLAKRDSVLTGLLNDSMNELTVSGDTCLFSIAKEKGTIQCIGGPEDLQKYDYEDFRSWIGSSFYDNEGRLLRSLGGEAPMMPREVNRQFRYVVTMKCLHEGDAFEDNTSFVFIPITMTRSGSIRYDLSCLEGLQLFYQERGTPRESTSILGTITAEEAIDPDRLTAIKVYMKDFLDQHEEVDSMRLWELILFNNPPESPKVSTAPAPSDSVMVIVDGIISPVIFKNNPVPPLELALQACPFLSQEDIDTVDLIKAREVTSNIILCYNPRDVLLITTHEESALHDYILNGKAVHKKKGVALGSLLDRKHLLADIKKKWGINPHRIEKLEVEEKTIRITTK